MAPKKKPQTKQSNRPVASSSSSIPNSNHKKPSKVPKLLISPEDEDHLRRLLLNFRRTVSPARAPMHSALYVAQKKKKIIYLYEKLSCEGFLNEQIESALSSLRDEATFETALDWLCLNFPSHELLLSYSSAASRYPTSGGSVSVISTSRKDCNESAESPRTGEDLSESAESSNIPTTDEGLVPVNGKRDEEETLGSIQSSQADWIRQYMRRLEEEEMESSDDAEVSGPRPFEYIAEEYCLERSDAVKAKRKGDKTRQKQAGLVICKIKQELPDIGISESLLESEFQREQSFEDDTEEETTSSMPDGVHESVNVDALSIQLLDDLNLDANHFKRCSPKEIQPKALPLSSSRQELDDILQGMELGDLFLEDVPPYEPSPHELMELQKKETLRELCNERNLGKLKGIWEKGQDKKIPKAILHQLCRKSGWEAPKFNKVPGEGSNFSYTISVMCKPSGYGKHKEPGGLVTFKLPQHQVEDFESVEVWALAPIPTPPHRFPCHALFTNVAYLFWQLPKDEKMLMFPWLMWYIWKARNYKLFSNLDRDPREVVLLAETESIAWETAQRQEELEDIHGISRSRIPQQPMDWGEICQFDGSWKETVSRAGLGWYYHNSHTGEQLMGASNLRRGLTPLQTELEAMVWAMQSMLSETKHIMRFETDCSDLVKMVSTPKEWPAFSILLEEVTKCRKLFSSFSIVYIPRTRNKKADKLARSARDLLHDVYHINSSPPVWITEPL